MFGHRLITRRSLRLGAAGTVLCAMMLGGCGEPLGEPWTLAGPGIDGYADPNLEQGVWVGFVLARPGADTIHLPTATEETTVSISAVTVEADVELALREFCVFDAMKSPHLAAWAGPLTPEMRQLMTCSVADAATISTTSPWVVVVADLRPPDAAAAWTITGVEVEYAAGEAQSMQVRADVTVDMLDRDRASGSGSWLAEAVVDRDRSG